MYIKNEISDSELLFINEYINTNKQNNLKIWKYTGGKTHQNNYSDGSSTYTYLPINKNDELINFITNRIGCSFNEITSIHIGRYDVGDFLEKHIDEDVYDIKSQTGSVTAIFMLKPSIKGGLLLLNDLDVELNKPGEYVIFDGQEVYHEVTEVEDGMREVLIVWGKLKPKNITNKNII